MSFYDDYKKHFPTGVRVNVGIPMENDELFSDWAIVNEIDNDIICLQMSRDELPVDIKRQKGKADIELRAGKEAQGFKVSATYVAKEDNGVIILRLSGKVTISELRDYYRIDDKLLIKFYSANNNDLDAVLQTWRIKKQNRREETLLDEDWETLVESKINISGGGLKFVTADDSYNIGDLIFQEVIIPTKPTRFVDVVARVVFKNKAATGKDNKTYYNVATQFIYIEEGDRDAILRYVSNLQMVRIREKRDKAVVLDEYEMDFKPYKEPLLGKWTSEIILVIILTVLMGSFLALYLRDQQKGEIQKAFEEGIKGRMQGK